MQTMVQGTQVYYHERGSGTPTIFLHGVPDSAELWRPIIDQLQSSYRCIAPDLPGLTTRSALPTGFDFTLPSMAQWLNDFVTALAIHEPINLVFGDFGGLYALAFAITYPERVGKLALAGSVGFTPDYEWHSTAKMWRTPILGEVSMMMLNEGMFANTMKTSAPLLTPQHWRDVYALSLANAAVKRNIVRLYRAIDTKDYATWEPKLLDLTRRVPMIVLWGDQDPFIDRRFADRFGAQQVQHYPNNGHWIAAEAPDEMAAQIAAFLG
ncbi:MAG TPA: alpha/beta hydrolase [Phototrophicaceae bacterium]|nr:alpha/beta hydrolase [Phototrophicaceae bacterium]